MAVLALPTARSWSSSDPHCHILCEALRRDLIVVVDKTNYVRASRIESTLARIRQTESIS